jgi:hypothetical protein
VVVVRVGDDDRVCPLGVHTQPAVGLGGVDQHRPAAGLGGAAGESGVH